MSASNQESARVDKRPVLELRGISKSFGALTVVKDVSLDVQAGEFVSLLGPSGCGKTTTLRMIAGFIAPDEGQIILGGKDITEMPSYRRDVGLLFQSYALFPHMTVRGNVGFGPKMRGEKSGAIAEKVRWALSLVKLKAMRTVGRTSFPAGSNSVLLSRESSRAARRCFCSMRHFPTSTRSFVAGCRRRFASFSFGLASPPFS